MTLSLDELHERIDTLEDENRNYRTHADRMESMWRLEDNSPGMVAARNAEGQEAVVLPTPYNIILLAERMFSHLPRIKVPSAKSESDDDEKARLRGRWLTALWQRINRQSSMPVLGSLVWQSLVLGRHALRVRWIRDELPDKLKDRRLPILFETPDPRCTFTDEDWRGTCFGVQGYRQRWRALYSFYGGMRPPDEDRADEWVETRDAYWLDDEGKVWNGVMASLPYKDPTTRGRRRNELSYRMEWVKEPVKTDYPEVPIIVGYGDSAPLTDASLRGLSLLYSLEEMWRYNNRLASGMATALLWNFNPMVWLENPQGAPLPDSLDIEPGMVRSLPQGVRPNQMVIQNNMGLMQAQMGTVDGAIQQSSFPTVMYGDPGSMTAGYPMQILAQQARGRTNKFRLNLERTLEIGNALALAMVEVDIWGGEMGTNGVHVWAESNGKSLYHVELKPGDIQGYYENQVTLVPDVPEDNAQKIATWLQMKQANIISAQTFRDHVLDIYGMPEDEDVRIQVEVALADPELQGKAMLRALQEYFPGRSWELMVAGTKYEQIAMQEEQWKQQREMEKQADRLARATERFRKTGKVPSGFHLMPDGSLMSDKDMEMQSGSGLMPSPTPAPPGGPMPNGGMPPSMPPMPPGLTPPQDTSGGMQMAGAPGLTVEQNAQIQPEGVGFPPNASPLESPFQQLVGGRMSDADMMRMIAERGT